MKVIRKMNYFTLIHTILDTASKHKLIEETYYGDIYEFENQPSRKYSNFVLTTTNTTEGEDITTYNFTAFVTDRLTDDKSNLIEVQSVSKTILSQILKETFDQIGDITYTFWTEKFNDLCAGCYASFSVSVPNEFTCADENMFEGVPYAIIFTQANPTSSYKVKVIKALMRMYINDKATSGWPLKVAKGFYEQTIYNSTNFASTIGYEQEYYNRDLSKEAIETFMSVAEECGVAQYIKVLYK